MIHRRGVLPVLVLLVLVLAGTVLQFVRATASTSPDSQPAAQATPAPPGGAARAVLHSLSAVERAYDAGDVRRLCRPGALVDPAVIRSQNARRAGCERELEALIANEPRLRVTARAIAVRPDLANVAVVTGSGTSAAVDFVRHGRRWLLSFSDGQDPLPALAGTT
jgi:hypothetical protein